MDSITSLPSKNPRKHPLFYQRHYEFIAGVIHDMKMDALEKNAIVLAFSSAFKQDNKNFSTSMFHSACFSLTSQPKKEPHR
jgi:HD superfamily phosphohydrolase YqeK